MDHQFKEDKESLCAVGEKHPGNPLHAESHHLSSYCRDSAEGRIGPCIAGEWRSEMKWLRLFYTLVWSPVASDGLREHVQGKGELRVISI